MVDTISQGDLHVSESTYPVQEQQARNPDQLAAIIENPESRYVEKAEAINSLGRCDRSNLELRHWALLASVAEDKEGKRFVVFGTSWKTELWRVADKVLENPEQLGPEIQTHRSDDWCAACDKLDEPGVTPSQITVYMYRMFHAEYHTCFAVANHVLNETTNDNLFPDDVRLEAAKILAMMADKTTVPKELEAIENSISRAYTALEPYDFNLKFRTALGAKINPILVRMHMSIKLAKQFSDTESQISLQTLRTAVSTRALEANDPSRRALAEIESVMADTLTDIRLQIKAAELLGDVYHIPDRCWIERPAQQEPVPLLRHIYSQDPWTALAACCGLAACDINLAVNTVNGISIRPSSGAMVLLFSSLGCKRVSMRGAISRRASDLFTDLSSDAQCGFATYLHEYTHPNKLNRTQVSVLGIMLKDRVSSVAQMHLIDLLRKIDDDQVPQILVQVASNETNPSNVRAAAIVSLRKNIIVRNGLGSMWLIGLSRNPNMHGLELATTLRDSIRILLDYNGIGLAGNIFGISMKNKAEERFRELDAMVPKSDGVSVDKFAWFDETDYSVHVVSCFMFLSLILFHSPTF